MLAAISWVEVFLGAMLGLLVSAFFYWRGQERKILDWRLLADETLVRTESVTYPELEVRWHGQLVTAPRVVLLEVFNAGNRSLVEQEFHEPVTLTCAAATVLNVEVTASSHPGVLAGAFELGDDSSTVTFRPKLLNREEGWTALLLVDGAGAVDVHSRIAGQTRPMRLRRENETEQFVWLPLLAASVTALVAGSLWLTSGLLALQVLAALLSLALGVYTLRRSRRPDRYR